MYNPSRASSILSNRKQLCCFVPYTSVHGLYTFFYIHIHCRHIQLNSRAVFTHALVSFHCIRTSTFTNDLRNKFSSALNLSTVHMIKFVHFIDQVPFRSRYFLCFLLDGKYSP